MALLQLRTSGDAELEVWAAARHAAPFERMLGKPLRVEVSHEIVGQPAVQPVLSPSSPQPSGRRPEQGRGAEAAERGLLQPARPRMKIVRPA